MYPSGLNSLQIHFFIEKFFTVICSANDSCIKKKLYLSQQDFELHYQIILIYVWKLIICYGEREPSTSPSIERWLGKLPAKCNFDCWTLLNSVKTDKLTSKNSIQLGYDTVFRESWMKWLFGDFFLKKKKVKYSVNSAYLKPNKY